MKQNTQQKFQRRLGMIVSGMIGAIGAMAFGYAIGKAVGKHAHPFRDVTGWQVFLIIIASCFMALALHELGHLVAGLWVKFRFSLYIVGPLRVERDEHDIIRVRFNRQIATYGGLCACLPTDNHDLLQRFARIIAGGPLASLIGGLVAIGVAQASVLPAPLRLFCLSLGTISLLLVVVTLIPMPNGIFLTDGARLLRLRRGGELAARDVALLQLYALSLMNKPTSEWSEEAIRASLTPQDSSIFEVTGCLFAYSWFLERNELETAGRHLDRCLEIVQNLRSSMLAGYLVEAAWFMAWHRGDVQAAESLMETVGKQPLGVRQDDILRARAAIALRSGKIAEGRQLLEQSEQQALSTTSNRWITARLSEMRQSLSSQSPIAIL
jgi:Zn-dependent protease